MIPLLAALIAVLCGGAAGWALARLRWGSVAVALTVALSTAAMFVIAGHIGGSGAVDALERFLGEMVGAIDNPISAIAVAPVAMTGGLVGMMLVPMKAMAWAICGTVLWVLGMGLGNLLATRRLSSEDGA